MEAKHLVGLTKRIRDITVGNPSEDLGKSLTECLIELSFNYSKKDVDRAIDLVEQIELDAKLLKRSLKQLRAISSSKFA